MSDGCFVPLAREIIAVINICMRKTCARGAGYTRRNHRAAVQAAIISAAIPYAAPLRERERERMRGSALVFRLAVLNRRPHFHSWHFNRNAGSPFTLHRTRIRARPAWSIRLRTSRRLLSFSPSLTLPLSRSLSFPRPSRGWKAGTAAEGSHKAGLA